MRVIKQSTHTETDYSKWYKCTVSGEQKQCKYTVSGKCKQCIFTVSVAHKQFEHNVSG